MGVRVAVLTGLLSVVPLSAEPAAADEPPAPSPHVSAKIDGFLESHWSSRGVTPAEAADDAEFLRRVTLDLAGRIPTAGELDGFLADQKADKRRRAAERLIDGPEFSLHFGAVLDQMIQTRHAGHEPFVDYLRRGVRESKPWDRLFREMMLGPWDDERLEPAARFLERRAKTADVLAVDTARAFFGVDISCAQCHDHPLVDDWKQEHFYGMVAFFNRTTVGGGKVGEKSDGEVTYLAGDGEEKVARAMFLSGRTVESPSVTSDPPTEDAAKQISRREQLVRVALQDQDFFSRSMVNRLWQYFFGRGLVDPVDQMHSGNASSVPGLLEWLADDFAASGYDLRRLVTSIVNSRAYQLSSRWPHDTAPPDPSSWAVASLRPLSQRQLAFALLQATGNGELAEPTESERRVARYVGVPGLQRIEQYLAIERQAAALTDSLDPRRSDFHSSVGEALFMSNNPAAQRLLSSGESNLATRLTAIEDDSELVARAVREVLSRRIGPQETMQLSEWFARQHGDRSTVCKQLVWALVTSAEFRFNH